MNDDRNREEDTKTFQMWFKINQPDADSYNICGLTAAEYSRLKHNDKYAYKFVKEMINSCRITVPDNVIKHIWKSFDDMDYSKNRSKVWDYFATIDSNSARCKFCQSVIKTSGNTSNLRGHLHSKHKLCIPTDLQLNTKKRSIATVAQASSTTVENKKSKTETQMSRNPVLDLYKKVNSYADGGVEAEKLTNSLLYMMAVDHMPLRCVEKRGLQKFLKTARPHYTMPSRKTMTKLMVDKYDVLKAKVMTELNTCPFYSITCDIWTDNSQKSYLGATAHYLSEDNLEIKSINLCVKELDVEHNAENISTALLSIFETFDLQKNKITAVISDSASNMVKSINDIFAPDKDKRLPCFAHRLSHVVPKAISKMPNVKAIIDKVKHIVTVTRKSVPASDELIRLQKRDGKSEGTALKFLQSVDTRWNSTFDMLERFLLLENYVYPVTSKCGNPPPMLSHEETSILRDLVRLMQPIMIIITQISGNSYLTSSIIIPAIAVVEKEVSISKPKTEFGSTFKAHLLTELAKQFNDIESFKTLCVSATTATEDSKAELLNKNNIWRHHDDLVAKTSATVYTTDGLTFELKQYISQPVIPRAENPLKHWQLLKPSYPNLYRVAMEYFCVVGTSVPCERLFSEAGKVKTDDRNRLSGICTVNSEYEV
ncbi:E3 SUMO-protein ligase ZBED1-like [Diprion similis]|uniref:E3 SUMO-protein ligase ZBED1-like n=1 Tax=Diprion similis TaxID=362088 RepID=UPI001EF82EBA|nr:E3 SUMO-protein ligase ZBED1-like [Diprion similis]